MKKEKSLFGIVELLIIISISAFLLLSYFGKAQDGSIKIETVFDNVDYNLQANRDTLYNNSMYFSGTPLTGGCIDVDLGSVTYDPDIRLSDLDSYLQWCKNEGAEKMYKRRILIADCDDCGLFEVNDTCSEMSFYKTGIYVRFTEIKVPKKPTLEGFIKWMESK